MSTRKFTTREILLGIINREYKMSKIHINGTDITVISNNDEDFICLTDMIASIEDGSKILERWLNTKTTVDFLGVWEQYNNPNFNSPEFRGIKIRVIVLLPNP